MEYGLPMFAYRVEHPHYSIPHPTEGTLFPSGPYCIGSDYDDDLGYEIYEVKKELQSAHSGCPEHPIAKLLWEAKCHGWLCGMASLKELYEWFDGYMPSLHFAGFVIGVYEFDDNYALDHGQVIFDPLTAVHREAVSIKG